MYKCRFCGYESNDLNDFEEDYKLHKGFWCPDCDGFTYFDEKEDNQNFILICETKSQLIGEKTQKVTFPTQVSPLRWPGGKSKFVNEILARCTPANMENFVEPFAGGASVGLSLLLSGNIKELYLNDLDYGVYSLFQVIKIFPEVLTNRIRTFIPSEKTFKEAQSKWKNGYENMDIIEAAWTLLVVNRLAFSGIPKANCMKNPGARWNADTLIKRIHNIAGVAGHIHVSCADACGVIEEMYWRPNTTIFIDPPYKIKGKDLYMKYYENNDHEQLSCLLDDLYKGTPGADMILTYDDCDYIKNLYQFPVQEIIGRNYCIAN